MIPTAATLVGFYFANAFRRRTRQEVMERRVDAYVAFWPVTRSAATTRLLGDWAGGPLTEEERSEIFDASTDWYYGTKETGKGYGLFLSAQARRVYLEAKQNLICPVDDIEPESVKERVKLAEDVDAARGEMSIRQLSLLRWVMRFDLQLHTEPYFTNFNQDEEAFLRSCGIDVTRRPWRNWASVTQDRST